MDPAGATKTIPASVSSEVREAINQAYLVSEGLAPPAKTINISPLPGLQSPAPQVMPSTAGLPAPRALSQQERALIKSAVARVLGSQRRSSRSHGPASSSSGTPRNPLWPSPHLHHLNSQLSSPKARPSPCPLVGAGYPLPCQMVAVWASLLQMSPCPSQKKLSDTPKSQQGYKWKQWSRPYVPWAPTDVQLWEAYRLLRGEGEWATPGVRYISEGSSKRSAAKPSLRWECTLCPQLVSSKLMAEGITRAPTLVGFAAPHSATVLQPAGGSIPALCWPSTWTSSTM